ncbi:MAG TPA: hypothetical protein VIY48_08605 [Candidatus Paceibacterota bacterium]
MSNPFLQDMVKLQLPEGMGDSLSVGGYLLKADKDRCIEVPKVHAKDLMAQGLSPYSGTLTLKK